MSKKRAIVLPAAETPVPAGLFKRMGNFLWAVLGFLFLALGIIGAFLPVLPTTIFLILATGCFAKSCPALKSWIWDHPRFGPGVRLWFEEGAIPAKAKILAVGMIVVSFAFTALLTQNPTVIFAVGATLLAVSVFILTRPNPQLPGFQSSSAPSSMARMLASRTS
ncbi:MAG: YbaN family protein, partial [Sphingomonadales bacterium]